MESVLFDRSIGNGRVEPQFQLADYAAGNLVNSDLGVLRDRDRRFSFVAAGGFGEWIEFVRHNCKCCGVVYCPERYEES